MAEITGFNANEHEPAGDFSPLPEGFYTVAIVESDWKDTKSGEGKYLEFKYQVIEGDHDGRFVWSRHNLVNQNEIAVRIARGELSALCRAVGVMEPKDSVELHDLPLQIKVKVKKREDNGEFTNEVKAWKSLMKAREKAPTGPSTEPPGVPQEPTAAETAPWKKRPKTSTSKSKSVW